MVPSSLDVLFAQLQESLEKEPKTLFVGEEPVYIYGAGNAGKDVFRILTHRGILVAGFLDRKAKSGDAWEGVSVLNPEDPAFTTAQRSRAHVVMGIFNCDTDMPPITAYLRSLGYGKITSFLEVHEHFAIDFSDRYWLTSRRFYQDKKEVIAAVNELWADEISRDIFLSVLKFRFERNFNALPAPSRKDQYFPENLPAWPGPMRLVDCGAYDGDTLRKLEQVRIPVEAVAAFEPDPANYQKLAETARRLSPAHMGPMSLFPCGVSAQASQIRFKTGQGTGSHASEDGEQVIQCVSLDDALPGFRPTLIKMDIEGAEYDALIGARRTIEQHRPGLAISVYHCADHLWTIPLLVKGWLKGGRHYLRSHAFSGFDLIYYWIP